MIRPYSLSVGNQRSSAFIGGSILFVAPCEKEPGFLPRSAVAQGGLHGNDRVGGREPLPFTPLRPLRPLRLTSSPPVSGLPPAVSVSPCEMDRLSVVGCQ